MARDAETIQREIEQAREGLAAALDQLSVRAHPQRFVESAKTTVRAKLQEPRVLYPVVGVGALVGILLVRKLFR